MLSKVRISTITPSTRTFKPVRRPARAGPGHPNIFMRSSSTLKSVIG